MIGTPDPARWAQAAPQQFGLMSGYAWTADPRHVLFTLARYKFVAKMLVGRAKVLEIGCADAFGTRLVAEVVRFKVTAIDVDEMMLESARKQQHPKIEVVHQDLMGPEMLEGFDGAYAIDVLEHIPRDAEECFMERAAYAVYQDGVFILGTPSAESQTYASEPSKEGHINCKTMGQLRELCYRYFKTVFMFGMNDEVLHTGFDSMCHYLWAVCAGPR